MHRQEVKACSEEWKAKHQLEPIGEKFWSFYIHIGKVKHVYTFKKNYIEAKSFAEAMAGVHKADAVTLIP